MIEQLKNSLQFIPTHAPEKQELVVCVEAGHIYTDEAPSLQHQIGAIVGKNVSNILEEMGVNVQKMLFIDDYNATSNDLDLQSYQGLLSENGFVPDKIIMESTLKEDAENLIAQLEANSLTGLNKHNAIILKKESKREKDIVLRKSFEKGGVPACAALDAALYLKKYQNAGICVTILHHDWREQQNSVKKVLKALGKNIPILEVYYSDDGDIEIDFDY